MYSIKRLQIPFLHPSLRWQGKVKLTEQKLHKRPPRRPRHSILEENKISSNFPDTKVRAEITEDEVWVRGVGGLDASEAG